MSSLPRTAAQQRRVWLAALEAVAKDPSASLAEMSPFTDADVPVAFDTLMSTMSDKDAPRMWRAAAGAVRAITPEEDAPLLGAPAVHYPEVDPAETEREASDIVKLRAMAAVTACCLAFATDLTATTAARCPPEFIEAAAALHDALWRVDGGQGALLQASIAELCERVWQLGVPGREACLAALMPYLLMRSHTEAKEADVKRLYAMRHAIPEFDLADPDTQQLRELLLQMFRHPAFLRFVDGRRLLSFFLTVDADLVDDIHAVIKDNLPGSPAKLVGYYGEVYHRAWSKAIGAVRLRIERSCLQDFMHAAIHAAQPATFKLCRQIIECWVEKKRDRTVSEVIMRCYDAILWRSLSTANPDVRRNATVLLVDAFPLQNPNQSREDTDACLEKQLVALQGLLDDPVPAVRVVATQGVCRVMSLFWELLPAPVSKAMLKKVATEMAHDVASAAVRATALKGIEFLSDNPLALPVLHRVLGAVMPLIHDRSEKVRVAFVQLLQRINGIRDLHWYEFVDVEEVLARLAMRDAKPIMSGLTMLLMPSFFPQGAPGAQQYKRAFTMIQNHETAALAFFQHVHRHATVQSVVKLALLLHKALHVTATRLQAAPPPPASKKRRRPRRGAAVESSSEEEEGEEDAGDTDLVVLAGMTKVVYVLWHSIEDRLDDFPEARDQLLASFSGEQLMNFLEVFVVGFGASGRRRITGRKRNGREQHVLSFAAKVADAGSKPGNMATALFQVASLLPGDGVAGLADAVWAKLETQSPAAVDGDLEPLVRVLCRWGQHERLMAAVVDSVTAISAAEPPKFGRKANQAAAPAAAIVMVRALEVALAHNCGDIRTQLFARAVPASLDTDVDACETSLQRVSAVLTAARNTLLDVFVDAFSAYTASEKEEPEAAAYIQAQVTALATCVRVLAKLHLHHAGTKATLTKKGSQLAPPPALAELMDWVADLAMPQLSALMEFGKTETATRATMTMRVVTRATYDAVTAVVATTADCVAAGGVDSKLEATLGNLMMSEVMDRVAVLVSKPPRVLPVTLLYGVNEADVVAASDSDGSDSDGENEVPGAEAAKKQSVKASAVFATAALLKQHMVRLVNRFTAARAPLEAKAAAGGDSGLAHAKVALEAAPMRNLLRARLLATEPLEDMDEE